MKAFKNFTWVILLPLVLISAGCYRHSPEKLPKYKRKFRTQIASFENQKEKTDDKVEDGVVDLTQLQQALENAKNVDKEFNRVYGNWNKVDKEVNQLFREYEDLKADAENLFSAMEEQTASLGDETTRGQLNSALGKTREDYLATLNNTEEAIEQLRALHKEAVDIIKALEVTVALGQIGEISEGLKNIEDRVALIMQELNTTVIESKDLYDKRISAF